ncbi:hypothetical protein [Planomonospora parontospora]|uniref:hypothetical protein n=1 Tax=Planomonospora parontospora TaxID=58119 RepID=UPI00166FDC0B|nr:hypothetical protein [Planomonospora parontospora]GGL50639.1 hypothetical protein GCM10014719_59960 [Planomonospora parontospora subsp. antibiotica]GII19014.1 hypothetical protein Ppa05_57400 [Planomonospora parontospora subsp. antibiotica]
MANGMASPEATGGAGVLFEYRVAALALSRLLRGAHVPVGIDLPVNGVALQQRIAGSSLDDIVMQASSADQSTTIEFQVKKTLSVLGSSEALISVLSQAMDTWRARPDDLDSGRLVLGVAAGEPEEELKELARLTGMARSHHTPYSFQLLLSENVTRRQLRTRHEHIVAAMAAAVGTTERAEAEALTHRVLSRLHVWLVDPTGDGRDWRAGLDDVRTLATASGQSADVLLGRLAELARTIGPHAGCLDADDVRAAFRSRFAIDLTATAPRPTAITINARSEGSGPMFVGDSQVFHGLTINTHKSLKEEA